MSDDWYEYCEIHGYICTSYSVPPYETCPHDGCKGRMYQIQAHYKSGRPESYRDRDGNVLRNGTVCIHHYKDRNVFCGRDYNPGKYYQSYPLCEEHRPKTDRGLMVWGQKNCPNCLTSKDNPIKKSRARQKFCPPWYPRITFKLRDDADKPRGLKWP